jgi:hypothetical protein
MSEQQRIQLKDLADKLQHIEELNIRLAVANERLVASNSRMAKAIIVLTDVIDGLLPHVVSDNQEVISSLSAANAEARRAAAEAAEELERSDLTTL